MITLLCGTDLPLKADAGLGGADDYITPLKGGIHRRLPAKRGSSSHLIGRRKADSRAFSVCSTA